MEVILLTIHHRFMDDEPIQRAFLSFDAAWRYVRMFHRYFPNLIVEIPSIKLNTSRGSIYTLTEDSHGKIGYFLNKEEAYEAARDVIMENPYWYDEDNEGDVYPEPHKISREDITNENIDNGKYLVWVGEYQLNVAWCQ